MQLVPGRSTLLLGQGLEALLARDRQADHQSEAGEMSNLGPLPDSKYSLRSSIEGSILRSEISLTDE